MSNDVTVVPAGPGTDVLMGTASKAQLDAYGAARRTFLEWLFGNLTPGVDYMLIHRKIGRGQNRQDCPNKADKTANGCPKCGGKATLCKPGSEKICGLLQLRPRFKKDEDTWQMLGAETGTLAVLCELVSRDDVVVAEGRGARKAAMDYDDVNKTIKMAQKSAQTDAVLRCAGLSEVFTQDLEDMPADPDKPVIARPQPVQAQPAAREPGEDDAPQTPEELAAAFVDDNVPPKYPGCITRKQVALLMATARNGRGETALRAKLQRQFKYEHLDQIKADLFDAILAWTGQQPQINESKAQVRR